MAIYWLFFMIDVLLEGLYSVFCGL